MKLKSILDKLKKGEGEVLEKIKITKYIPFSTKRAITKNVAMQVTFKDEDVYDDEGELFTKGTEQLVHDVIYQDLLTFAYKIAFLTDIEIEGLIDEDNIINFIVAEEAHNQMGEVGIYDYINEQFINDDIDEIITYEVNQELQRNNSTANILKIIIEDLVSKIPTQEDIGNLMTQIPSQLEGLKDLKFLNNKSNVKSNTNKKSPKSKVAKEIKEVKDNE